MNARSVARNLLSVLVLSTPLGSALAQQFIDTTFLDSQWTGFKLDDSTPDSDAVFSGIRGSGGNPGDCRVIAHNWQVVPEGVSVLFGHCKKSLPVEAAFFRRLHISFDVRCDSAPNVNAIGFGPLLVQSGRTFVAGGTAALAGSPWKNYQAELSANDWNEIGGGAKPDFSDSAEPIFFGFYSGNGGSGFTARLTASGRVDNFRVRALRSCPADLNNDGIVEDADFTIFVAAYDILDCAHPDMPGGCAADLNFDGSVEDQDFTVFVIAYNDLICP